MRSGWLFGVCAALLFAQAAAAQTDGSTRNRAAGDVAEQRSGAGGSGPVVIDGDVIEAWDFLYRHITEVEFVLCLDGERRDGVIHVDGYRLARMEEATRYSVRYHPCGGERYVGTAHNHPPVAGSGPLCYHSAIDRRSFELDRRAQVDVVLCGEGKYVWKLRDGTRGGPGADLARGHRDR